MSKLACIILSLLIGSISIAQEKDYYICKSQRSHMQLKSSPNVNASQIEQMKKYDVTFYKLDLGMTNTSAEISGVTEVHSLATQAIDSALLELYNGYIINGISVNGQEVDYARYGELVSIPVGLTEGDEFIITIDYEGSPPPENSFMGVAGLNNQTSYFWEKQITYSLSEPFGAFEWFPCKQELRDKADSVQVTITVPENLMAGSNGVLDSITVDNGFKTFHWMHRHPIDYYLISVAVGEYREYNIYAHPVGNEDSVLIQNFIYDDDYYYEYYKDGIDNVADYIELFAELYGPYPFENEKYGHCSAPFGGGMEHQTMTTQESFEKTLTAHELAHQWFGNNVTCSSWADIWMNEGFASYSEYLMLEYLYLPSQALSDIKGKQNSTKDQIGGSVWVADSLNENAIFNSRLVYKKGGAIIHTLRYILADDSLFFGILKDFQADYTGGVASGLDFKAYLEAKSGIDFTEFFEQWYFGEGYPTYSVEYFNDGTTVNVLLEHTTSMPTVTPLFTNPVDLLIKRSNAEDTIIRVEVTSNQHYFTLEGIDDFVAVKRIDPSFYLIKKIGSITENPSLTIENNQLENEAMIVYPNPTEGELTVDFIGNEARTIRVFNQKGQLVLEKLIKSSAVIDLSALSSGQYLVDLSYKGKSLKRKVIKR